MRLYEIEVCMTAKQRITVSAPNEEWACDLATDKVDVREAVVTEIVFNGVEDVTEIYGVPA